MQSSYDPRAGGVSATRAGRLRRRQFLKATLTATAAAVGGSAPVAGGGVEAPLEGPSTSRLGNAEPPALQYQAYPGGTGALLEAVWRDSPRPFGRTVTEVRPWTGPRPRSEADVAFLPVHRLAALLRERHLSASELVEIYLERLRRYDPRLACVVTVLEGAAREAAAQADTELRDGRWRGPLHGIPYGLKDVFAARGTVTTWGASAFRDQRIDVDAEVVTRLREAGAILVAKLATGELARGDRWFRGQTRNPWNVEEGASGSSAGPASATAAGCVGFAIGTETQGSIVSPARRCGVSALRPTFGRVSRYGGMVLAWSMDKVGPLCRTIEDCALVFEAIHGSDEKDPASLTAPFAFTRTPELSDLRIGHTPDAPEAFLEGLRHLGADPRPMSALPRGSSRALRVESAAAFDFHLAPHGEPAPLPEDLPTDELRRAARFRIGRAVGALEYVQDQRRRFLLMQEMARAMDGVDMFVSGTGLPGLTNQTGHPAVVVPFGFGPRDDAGEARRSQPLTTTLIGALFADDKVLSVAHAYQEATTWHRRRPVLDA